MAWTTPRTWVAGEKPTAATFNTHVRDNLNALKDGTQSGTVTTASIANGANGDTVVTFPTAFASAPNVVVSVTRNTSLGHLYHVWVTTASTTSFTLRCRNDSGSANTLTVSWIANL